MLGFIIALQLAHPQAAVQQIDWRNVALEGDIQLTDGQWSLEVDPGVFETVDLESVVYADVTADGIDDAILLTTYHSTDAASISSVYVYNVRGAEPVLVAELPTDAVITDFRVEGGVILVAEQHHGAVRTTAWRVGRGRATRVDPDLRAQSNPATPADPLAKERRDASGGLGLRDDEQRGGRR